jgi:hypothetical protein
VASYAVLESLEGENILKISGFPDKNYETQGLKHLVIAFLVNVKEYGFDIQ